MNIYKYIRSKDVREYNEKIRHKFNATESAFLVWLNGDISLKEKHDAWREIMQEFQDEEVSKRPNVDYVASLFALLNKFIQTDNELIDEFYKKDEQAVYSFRYYCRDDSSWYEDYGRIYTDFEYMKRETEKYFDLDIICIEYTKKYLSSPYRQIMLVIDKSGNVMSIDGESVLGNNNIVSKDEFFEGLWIDVPTPFKYGDIVYSKKTPFGYNNLYSDGQPFVLLSLANWSAKQAEERGEKLSKKEKACKDKLLKYHREHGDITDMTASGYFLSSDYNDRFTGGFYNEVMHDYVDLEYYHGEFTGGERVLLSIKYFLNGDIDEETFAKAYEIIKKQEDTKEGIRYLNLLDEWIEKLKIKEK